MKHLKFSKSLSLILLLLIPVVTTADMFGHGTKRLSVLLGRGQAFGDDYTILGLGFGYYVYDGLELAINWDSWQGGEPEINQVTPEIRYVFRNQSSIDPYVGVLYRWTSISGFDDETAYGFRAGVYIATGRRSFIGIGAAYVETTSCDERVYVSCSDTYPEFSFAVSF